MLASCRPQSAALEPDFYPLGLYAVPSTNDFAEVSEAGFNLVVGVAEQSYLDAAQSRGLKVLATPQTSAGARFDADRAKASLQQFNSHPSLWAWYLVDEPDLHHLPPEQVKQANDLLKSWPHAKPTALSLFQGYEARYYANITDILMVDRYPIPWLPLANFGQHIQMARLALPPEKPLLAIVQAFDWNSSPELLMPREENLRPPTEVELRCMTYDALARGANGLFYYAFDTGRWRIREHPQTWMSLKRVVAEVNARKPLFLAEQLWWAKLHEFSEANHRYNAALESSITSCLLSVRQGNSAVPAGRYILAVNNTDWNLTYSFALPQVIENAANKVNTRQRIKEDESKDKEAAKGNTESKNLEVKCFGEDGRTAAVKGNRVTDSFAPYAVHIYGPL